jgi:hypothetical protein
MQVVIDIDEDTYKDIKKGKVYSSIRDVPQESVLAIANGTPLPKGHGNLIDKKEVYKKFYCRCLAGVAKEVLEETTTIIKADRSEEDG